MKFVELEFNKKKLAWFRRNKLRGFKAGLLREDSNSTFVKEIDSFPTAFCRCLRSIKNFAVCTHSYNQSI